MQVQQIKMDRIEASRLFREYKKHKHYSTPVDQEVMRAYDLLAAGKMVIRALESITVAGLNDKGFPKLAIAPADAVSCHCEIRQHGAATLDSRTKRNWLSKGDNVDWYSQRAYFTFPRGSFPTGKEWQSGEALVPGIPLHLRPQRGLANYHILWEAEWTKIVPKDPFLLRRIGKSDLWLVCAHWDLTDVERGALQTRIGA